MFKKIDQEKERNYRMYGFAATVGNREAVVAQSANKWYCFRFVDNKPVRWDTFDSTTFVQAADKARTFLNSTSLLPTWDDCSHTPVAVLNG